MPAPAPGFLSPSRCSALLPPGSREAGMPGSSSHFLITNFAGLFLQPFQVALPPEFPGVYDRARSSASHPRP